MFFFLKLLEMVDYVDNCREREWRISNGGGVLYFLVKFCRVLGVDWEKFRSSVYGVEGVNIF